MAIAWLDRPPANSISSEVVHALRRLWDAVREAGKVRSLVIASANPMLFCAGADIKSFMAMDAAAGKELLDGMHGLLREIETSPVVTIAAVNAMAFGGGCELAMACDLRIAAESAVFGQPEISLGIIPGFGGTQRLPRLVGEGRALELNLTGDPISAEEAYAMGLANRVVADETLFDASLAWARNSPSRRRSRSSRSSACRPPATSTRGSSARRRHSSTCSPPTTDARGSRRLCRSASHGFPASERDRRARARALARLASLIGEAGSVVALTGAGISVPSGIPDFRTPQSGIWSGVDPMEVAHIDAFHRDPERFWSFYGERFQTLEDKRPNRAHAALVELERAGLLDAVITQNIDRLHERAGSKSLIEVHGTIAHSSCLVCAARYELGDVRARHEGAPDRVPRCECGEPLKPDVVLFGEYLPVEALARAEALAAGADLMLCIGSSLEVHPVAQLPETTLSGGGQIAILTQSRTPLDHRAAVRMHGDVVEELEAVLAALGLAIPEATPEP